MKSDVRGSIVALSSCFLLLTVGLSAAEVAPALAGDGEMAMGSVGNPDALAEALLPESGDAARTRPIDPASLTQEQANLATTDNLRTILDQQPASLARSVALAQEATRAQARTLGLLWIEPPLPTHATPAEAALTLLARYGLVATAEQERNLATLGRLPEPTRAALTRVLDAFLAFDAAATHAYAGADLPRLHALGDEPANMDHATPLAGTHGASLAAAGLDLAPLFPARDALLEAVAGMHDALPPVAGPQAAVCSPVAVLPAFSIDLSTCDNTYGADVALLLDAGGNDLYLNNAGGSDVLGSGCNTLPAHAAAALIDLAGVDRYVGGRDCGTNGGGFLGVGFLLDARGDDTYTAGSHGTNGGGRNVGVGFLLDATGDDTYTAGQEGTNGGAAGAQLCVVQCRPVPSVGFLLDGTGDDAYGAGGFGTNGGGFFGGVGLLLDAADNDTYVAGGAGTNGGAFSDGVGLLHDAGGTDNYSDSNVPSGTGIDRTVLPKGILGGQIDSDDPPP